jgi:hypothetical protein
MKQSLSIAGIQLKKRCLFIMITFVIVTALSFAMETTSKNELMNGPDTGPLNAKYLIQGKSFQLVNGKRLLPVAQGSATRIKTIVLGKPVYGDMTGDGDKDAALLILHDSGGSGSFYYVAAALNEQQHFKGTNALLLGDRIIPKEIKIRNGSVLVKFVDLHPEESMSTTPSITKSIVLILNNSILEAVAPKSDEEQILEGWVVISHEVTQGRKD